jgi:hypothetical protein
MVTVRWTVRVRCAVADEVTVSRTDTARRGEAAAELLGEAQRHRVAGGDPLQGDPVRSRTRHRLAVRTR